MRPGGHVFRRPIPPAGKGMTGRVRRLAMTLSPQTTAPLGTTTGSKSRDRPRIYVACLAAYNNGFLHGACIEASEPHEVMAAVTAMLSRSPEPDAEEWAIHDYDGFEGVHLSEYAGFDTVCALSDFIEKRGPLAGKLYNHFGNDLEQARAAFDDYAGEFASLADFAQDLNVQTGLETPPAFQYYIDWQAMGRDMELNGDVFTVETGFDQLHIFWSR